MAAPANFSALLAAPGATDYGFDTHIATPDDDSTPIASPAPPAAPADTDSTPIAPPAAPADTDSTPIESPVPPLSDDELQAKMKRWGPMLSGDSMTTPADLVEMQSSGKFTPGQLQRAQTESSLRQTYIQQQARTLGQKVGAGLSSGWDTVKNIAQDVTPGLRDYQTYQELAANPQADITENRGRVANSLLEGGYGAAAGVGSLAKGLITGSLHYLKNAVTGPRTAAQSEQDYQDWKKDYIATHAVPGYAPPAPSAVQNAESYYTGVAPENLPAPVAPLVSLASTAASIPAFGAAAGLGEAAIPKILAATGAEAVAPNLSKLLIPTTAAAKLKGAMSDALAKGAGEAVTPALDTAATKNLPITSATPEQAAAIQAANPSLLDRVNAAGKPISDKVDSTIAGIKALPGNLAEATAGAVSKAGEVAQAPAGVLDKLFAKLPSGDTPVSSYIRYKFLDHIPFFGQAVQAVKALEGAGKLTAGLGDFMERMATANPLDPMGRFAAAAEAAPAGHWMKAVVNNPALKMALKVGTLAGDTAAATAKGAAAGAALGVASNQSPEEIGQAAGGLAAFSGAHGAMSAGQARILDAQIGGVAKVVTDHIAGGGSPDTLKLVPASDILTAANLKSALPDYTVRFATDSDGTKPPVAQGQAGYYDRANKTLWIDPENRAPGSTILHEAFHPIFDQLVAEQPNIKAALDQALARNGDSIDRFKLEYANRVAKGDPGQASDYIAGQDKANPDWAYSEMLSEAASHALDGKDLLQAMQGNDVQQSATQTALQGVEGWLSDNGVDLQQRQNTGTIFPDFKDSFNDPDLRRLTYRLLKAQRDSLFSRTPEEAPGTPLTSSAMGGAVAPTYNENGRQINQYGEVKDTPTGKKFVPFPASEIRRRMSAEKVALPKYFPEVGKNYTTMPAGLLADPDISPWTKNTLKTMFDAKDAQNKVSFWNQGLSGKKSAVSDVAWARQVARDLGNVEARYQSGRFTGVKRSKANNLVMELDSEEAENQRLADWSQQHGPVSLDLWGGNQAAAKADIETYKKNLAANLPGETGLSVDKKNVLNALLAGDNKEFQASNPLRSLLKKKDRAATFRSFRPERVGAISTEPTDVPAVKWERAKANLSPAAAEEVKEPEKRMIELTGPDGKKYPAKYDGLQENFTGGAPWIQVTPQVDLPGSTGKFSTTYEPSLLKKGYTLPADLKAEVDKYNAANPPKPMKFSASEDPRAIASAAVQDEDTGKIYVGANHDAAAQKAPTGRASNLIDGYVTNSGKFLDRDTAFKQAVALKQYKPGPEDRNINQELYGLTSERFNKQNPNTYAGIQRAKAALEKKGNFSPAQPETISRPAVRVDKEHDFESDSYSGAYAKARKAGVITEDDQGGPRTEEGFKTSAGRFVDRAEGYRLASAANQVHTREPALTGNGTWLDSSNVKAFSPASKETEKLSYPMEMTPGHNTGVLPGLLKAPYDVRERYQADMLKAMEPLFAAFGAKPGATTKSLYKNSAGEIEHNPATAVEVPAQDAKLFGLLHGHFANQEAVAGGFQETSPGKWEPVGPHSFYVQPTGGETFADKIKEMGPEAEDVLNKLQPVVGPAVEAVNKKYSGLHSHQLSPSQDPRAVRSAAVKDETTGKVYTGSYHGEAFEKYLAKNPGASLDVSEDEEDNGGIYGAPAHLTEGFVTNKGDFLDRQEALERAMEMKQYKDASPDKDYGLESVSFEHQKKMDAKPDQFSPSEEPSEPAPFVPTGVLKHRSNHPDKAAAAVADAKPGQPIALGTFSPPQMSDKAFEKLAGKKMLFVVGDQSNAGPMYKTEGGKEAVRMQGGPGYPNMPDTQGKAGWAFASKHLVTRLSNAFKNVDYMAVFVGSPDMIAGAPSFSKVYLAELHEALASGQLKPGVLNRMAREAVRYAKTRSSGGNSIPTVHNFGELEQLLSQPSDRWNKDPLKRGLSFESRSIIIQQLGGVQSSKKFGTPAYRLVRDKYNDTGAFEQGQLAQIIKLHPDKPIGTAEEHDVPNYPDYPYVIPGTGLGQPSTKLMMADVLKPWTHTPKIAAQGGNLDYKVRMNMPQTEINPALFENK